GLGDLEVAPRGPVHRDELALALDAQARHVRERRLLRLAAVREERARGADRRVHALAAVAREVRGPELAREVAARGGRIELPRIEALDRRAGARRRFAIARDEELRGLQPL